MQVTILNEMNKVKVEGKGKPYVYLYNCLLETKNPSTSGLMVISIKVGCQPRRYYTNVYPIFC